MKYEDVIPDAKTGLRPTRKQFEIIKTWISFGTLETPFEIRKAVAKETGLTEEKINAILGRLALRCPDIWAKFIQMEVYCQRAVNNIESLGNKNLNESYKEVF